MEIESGHLELSRVRLLPALEDHAERELSFQTNCAKVNLINKAGPANGDGREFKVVSKDGWRSLQYTYLRPTAETGKPRPRRQARRIDCTRVAA